ncbi:ATP-dependent dethiobiotin synthetase BioD 2 [Bacteroidia bacterium]|nr:ATP-dependent dethiobiotin synthetase BioD 2 [Bacteroidia bacterium]
MTTAYFVSGIDTDVGKSVVTGILARSLQSQGHKVITQKFVQTGCVGISEDIETHRHIMGIELQEVDLNGTTCPFVFAYPASPHLAAAMDNKQVEPEIIRQATKELERKYEIVLVEGAGGLYVPISHSLMTIDYIRNYNYPLILVTSPKLGSINHTLMSLELCRLHKINVAAIVYNDYPKSSEPIKSDTLNIIKYYICRFYPHCQILELPFIENMGTGGEYPSLLITRTSSSPQ